MCGAFKTYFAMNGRSGPETEEEVVRMGKLLHAQNSLLIENEQSRGENRLCLSP